MANIMVQGTTSSSGKSLVSTGLCRILTEDGYNVMPFKSQNMAGSSYLTDDSGEISPAQALQAIACKQAPHSDMNPVLMLPTSFTESNIIINGKKHKNMTGEEYFKSKDNLKDIVAKTYSKLEKQADIVVLEGAGSPAEINLKANDFVNMGLADMVDAPVVLVADIERGGVFASLYGTVKLLEEHEQKRVKGMIINKFRGDISLLNSGLKMIEELLGIPILGVIPFMELKYVEDSLIEWSKTDKKIKDGIENDILVIVDGLRKNLDMEQIYEIIGLKNTK